MRHYRVILLFLAMLCYSRHAFGQATQWLDDGGDCTNGLYYGDSLSVGCGTYGASVYGYISMYAYGLASCGLNLYAGAWAYVYHYGGVYPDMVSSNSELAFNGTDPGFDIGFVSFWDANGDGYNEGEELFYCLEVGGYGGP